MARFRLTRSRDLKVGDCIDPINLDELQSERNPNAQWIGARAHVVGTNDLANAQVVNGTHATHILIRRSYVDERGASWDGPGVVAHAGYGHWYVDNEIVQAAKDRGVWGMALGSIVEHHHPIYDPEVPQDDTYRKGQSTADQDRRRYKKRLAQNSPPR